MRPVTADFLRHFSGRELNFAECLRTLFQSASEVAAPVLHETLLEAVDAGYLVRTATHRYRLTKAGEASANWASPPNSAIEQTAADSQTIAILKVHPEDCPAVINQRLRREFIFSSHNTNDSPISLERVTLENGEESTPHAHIGTHTVIYTLRGTVRVYWGPGLERAIEVGPNDCVYIPPGVIHHVVNEQHEPMMAVVARSTCRHEVVEHPHLLDRIRAVSPY